MHSTWLNWIWIVGIHTLALICYALWHLLRAFAFRAIGHKLLYLVPGSDLIAIFVSLPACLFDFWLAINMWILFGAASRIGKAPVPKGCAEQWGVAQQQQQQQCFRKRPTTWAISSYKTINCQPQPETKNMKKNKISTKNSSKDNVCAG